MRSLKAAFALSVGILATNATLAAQCPYYSDGTISAGLSRFNGGTDARLVYVDCVASIGVIEAKFGTTGGSTNLNGLPLTIAILDDPTNDSDPSDAIFVAEVSIPAGVTGGNTDQWQRYDVQALFGAPIAATGGMWIAVSVTYPSGLNPGPGSIEFFNNNAPGTQWLATDNGGLGIDFHSLSGTSSLVDIQTGPGFPAGSWVIRIESGAEYRTFGSGCPGSNGTPTLAGGAVLPVIGQVALLDASNLPNPSIADLLLLSTGLLTPAIDLGNLFGTSPVGCDVSVPPTVVTTLATVAGTASIGIAIPNAANLVGYNLLGQVISIDPTANSVGWTSSNGVRTVIGY